MTAEFRHKLYAFAVVIFAKITNTLSADEFISSINVLITWTTEAC